MLVTKSESVIICPYKLTLSVKRFQIRDCDGAEIMFVIVLLKRLYSHSSLDASELAAAVTSIPGGYVYCRAMHRI